MLQVVIEQPQARNAQQRSDRQHGSHIREVTIASGRERRCGGITLEHNLVGAMRANLPEKTSDEGSADCDAPRWIEAEPAGLCVGLGMFTSSLPPSERTL